MCIAARQWAGVSLHPGLLHHRTAHFPPKCPPPSQSPRTPNIVGPQLPNPDPRPPDFAGHAEKGDHAAIDLGPAVALESALLLATLLPVVA